MSKILLRTPDQAVSVPLPGLQGLSAEGHVETLEIVAGQGFPLSLWSHDVGADGTIKLEGSDVAHLFFVLHGVVEASGEQAVAQDAIIAECGATMAIAPKSGDAQLLHFYCPKPCEKDLKSQGAVRVMRKSELGQHVHPQTEVTLYSDCTSETCDLWLHSGETPAGLTDYQEQMHYHTQDEIIYVVEGSMLVGPRRVPTGTALAVAKDTVYSFEIEDDALHFINFSPGPSSVAMVEGDDFSDELPEIEFINSLPLRKAA